LFHTRIVKLLNLSSSTNEHEALSAIRMANEIVRKNGLTWDTILIHESPPEPSNAEYIPVVDMINKIRASVGDGFDTTFIDSIDLWFKKHGTITGNQRRALHNIYNIYVGR